MTETTEQGFVAGCRITGVVPEGWTVNTHGNRLVSPDGTEYAPWISFERITRAGDENQNDDDYTDLVPSEVSAAGIEVLEVIQQDAELYPLED